MLHLLVWTHRTGGPSSIIITLEELVGAPPTFNIVLALSRTLAIFNSNRPQTWWPFSSRHLPACYGLHNEICRVKLLHIDFGAFGNSISGRLTAQSKRGKGIIPAEM